MRPFLKVHVIYIFFSESVDYIHTVLYGNQIPNNIIEYKHISDATSAGGGTPQPSAHQLTDHIAQLTLERDRVQAEKNSIAAEDVAIHTKSTTT